MESEELQVEFGQRQAAFSREELHGDNVLVPEHLQRARGQVSVCVCVCVYTPTSSVG